LVAVFLPLASDVFAQQQQQQQQDLQHDEGGH
jgi:hypothetical protein